MAASVLLIDDDSVIRILASHALQRREIHTDTCVSGEEALHLLQHNEYDLVIVDLYLPGMDGFTMLDWLRQHRPSIVSVVLSGTTRMEDVIQAMHRGAFDFIAKPIEQYEVFLQQVRRALEHKNLRDSHTQLLREFQQKNVELENRCGQLEMAHSILQVQARAMQASLRRAQHIQQALLPTKLPYYDRVSMAVYYQPADKVGGDFYDVFSLDEDRFGFYIADTSGHGVGSALVTMYLKHAFQPMEYREGKATVIDPGVLLRHLNAHFCECPFGHDLFVSLTYVIIDTRLLQLQYANAGHPPLLVRHLDGTLEELRIPAPALGINPEVKHSTGMVQLRAGDLIAAYSDGVQDTENEAGEFYGRDRLRQFLSSASFAPKEVIPALEKALYAFRQPASIVDDTTFLAVSIGPQDGPEISRWPAPGLCSELDEQGSMGLMSASEGGVTYVSITGPGTWRESRYIADLFEEAHRRGDRLFVLDFGQCNHLDSTFHGVLHSLCSEVEKKAGFHMQLQNLPRTLLREMSELGLTSVLLHFSSKARSLPDAMASVNKGSHTELDAGQFLLDAHEALVSADPRNADRFAAVLKVLHARAMKKTGVDGVDEAGE